jgi:prevent-host-death family protein
MRQVGVRELKQNASAVVAEAAAGEIITITSRGKPVAQLVPLRKSRIQAMIDAGLAQPATGSWADLPPPAPAEPGQRPLSEVLAEMRDEERW